MSNHPLKDVVRTSAGKASKGLRKVPVRLVVAGAGNAIRHRIEALALRPRAGVAVVAVAEKPAACMALLERVPCDALLAALDGDFDTALASWLAPVARRVPVVVVSASEDAASCLTALRLGVRALLSSHCEDAVILRAIHAAGEGHVWLSPALLHHVVENLHQPASELLTRREREIIAQVKLAHRNHEIAKTLHISPNTVKKHLGVIFQKLGVRNRVDLTMRAMELGLLGLGVT